MATLARTGLQRPARPVDAAAERPTAAAGVYRPRSSRVPRLLLLALALAVLGVVGLLQVLQTSHAATAGYGLRALEQERSQLAAEIRLIEAEIAGVARLELVHAAAIERLGMVAPAQTMRVAVGVDAPSVIPLPERYVPRVEGFAPIGPAVWERALRLVPGID